MKVFVAGATGALGVPVVELLVAAGNEVTGMTRWASNAAKLERLGAKPAVADALDPDAVGRAVRTAAPDAIVSLLTKLPKRGPKHARHLRPNAIVHRHGTANMVAAAKAAGVERIVAESVIFRYGYGDLPPRLTEDDAPAEKLPRGAPAGALDAVKALEKTVLGAGGIGLRYGVFYGPGAGHQEFMALLLCRRLFPLPGKDRGALSWIHLDDAAAATVAALERGSPGQVYNICDDEPASIFTYARELARAVGAKPPWSAPTLVWRLFTPYALLSLTGTVTMSNDKAKRELGWAPQYPSVLEGVSVSSRSE